MKHHPTPEKKDERFHIAASKSWLQAIDEWSLPRRIRSRAEAVRQLVELGLCAPDSSEAQRPDQT